MDAPEEVFCRELRLDLASAKQLLDSNNFQSLRIIDIKNILKYYRDNLNYYAVPNHVSISLTASKAELVKLLERVMPAVRRAQNGLSPSCTQAMQREGRNSTSNSGSKVGTFSARTSGDRSSLQTSSISSYPRVVNTVPSRSYVAQQPLVPATCTPPTSSHIDPATNVANPPLSLVDAILINPINRAVVNELHAAAFPTQTISRVLNRMYADFADRPDEVSIDFDTMMCVMIEDLGDDGEVS